MTTNQYRHPAEADARTKEKGTTPFESAPQANQTDADSTTARPLYQPLKYRGLTPLEVALRDKPIQEAQLEALNRIADALEKQVSAIERQTKSVDDLWRLFCHMGGRR